MSNLLGSGTKDMSLIWHHPSSGPVTWWQVYYIGPLPSGTGKSRAAESTVATATARMHMNLNLFMCHLSRSAGDPARKMLTFHYIISERLLQDPEQRKKGGPNGDLR